MEGIIRSKVAIQKLATNLNLHHCSFCCEDNKGLLLSVTGTQYESSLKVLLADTIGVNEQQIKVPPGVICAECAPVISEMVQNGKTINCTAILDKIHRKASSKGKILSNHYCMLCKQRSRTVLIEVEGSEYEKHVRQMVAETMGISEEQVHSLGAICTQCAHSFTEKALQDKTFSQPSISINNEENKGCITTVRTSNRIQNNRTKNNKEDTFTCSNCLRNFSTSHRLDFHMQHTHTYIYTNYWCIYCHAKFLNPTKLKFHLNRTHNVLKCTKCKQTLFNIRNADVDTFVCLICRLKMYLRKFQFPHKFEMNPREESSCRIFIFRPNKPQCYYCTCDKKNLACYVKHLRVTHNHQESNCARCKSRLKEYNLNFLCQVCLSYCYHSDLDKNIGNHNVVQTVCRKKCFECGYLFHQDEDIKKHVELKHYNENVCVFCKTTINFYDRSYLTCFGCRDKQMYEKLSDAADDKTDNIGDNSIIVRRKFCFLCRIKMEPTDLDGVCQQCLPLLSSILVRIRSNI